MELAYRTWAMLDATDWKHLPNSGGLLEQDEALMDDTFTVEFMARRVKESKRDT